MKTNSRPNSAPAMSPGTSVPSRRLNDMPRPRAHSATSTVAMTERIGAWGDGSRGRLPDRAAALADQEHDEIVDPVIVDAGDERVAALDAVDETVLLQEIERAVDSDRSRSRSGGRGPLDDLVGAERPVARE